MAPGCYVVAHNHNRLDHRSALWEAKTVQKEGDVSFRREPLDRMAVLGAHPFFKGLDPSIVNALGPRAVTRALRKGAVLFRKGDKGSSLYLLLSGLMRIDAPSEAGRSAVFNLILPGEIFGEIAALDGGVRTADAVAIDKSDVMVIDRRDIVPVLRDHPDLGLRLIEILCSRVRRTSEQVEDIVFLEVAGRLAKLLLFLHDKATSESAEAKIRVTQREISQMVGASRESTNKQLRQWERAKLLRIERGAIALLQRDRLAQQIAEA
jgi:CRP/FNR family transcriptional regulator, cyclic AMP receptor protein